jgi:hypothetical protein
VGMAEGPVQDTVEQGKLTGTTWLMREGSPRYNGATRGGGSLSFSSIL